MNFSFGKLLKATRDRWRLTTPGDLGGAFRKKNLAPAALAFIALGVGVAFAFQNCSGGTIQATGANQQSTGGNGSGGEGGGTGGSGGSGDQPGPIAAADPGLGSGTFVPSGTQDFWIVDTSNGLSYPGVSQLPGCLNQMLGSPSTPCYSYDTFTGTYNGRHFVFLGA